MKRELGIALVKVTYGTEVAENMQKNPEDMEVLEQIGSVATELQFLYSCKLTTNHAASSYGQPVLVSGGIAYGPNDQTPGGKTARELIRGNFNSIQMELPPGISRCVFADQFCRI